MARQPRLRLMHVLQGLMGWDPPAAGSSRQLRVLSNRVSTTSEKQARKPIHFANSVVISPTTAKVYFTSSTNVPPPYGMAGVYDTMRSAQLTHLTVRHLTRSLQSAQCLVTNCISRL